MQCSSWACFFFLSFLRKLEYLLLRWESATELRGGVGGLVSSMLVLTDSSAGSARMHVVQILYAVSYARGTKDPLLLSTARCHLLLYEPRTHS